jgi:putative FmdB family regulatory protein
MPIYEYECQDCGHKFEKLQKVSDTPIKICEKCAGRADKLVSRAGFRLQGSGWYETDFKTDKDKKKNLAESAASQSAPEASSTKPTTPTTTKQE